MRGGPAFLLGRATRYDKAFIEFNQNRFDYVEPFNALLYCFVLWGLGSERRATLKTWIFQNNGNNVHARGEYKKKNEMWMAHGIVRQVDTHANPYSNWNEMIWQRLAEFNNIQHVQVHCRAMPWRTVQRIGFAMRKTTEKSKNKKELKTFVQFIETKNNT